MSIDMKAFMSMDMGMFAAVEKDAVEERQGAAWHHGMSALHLASKHGHAELVRVLLDAKATPDLRSSEPQHSGWTALHYAAEAGHLEAMRLLIDGGADVANEAEDILGDPTGTALHVAAANGHVRAVQLLLKHGAKHANTAGGDTPLARAAANGHHDVIRALLDAGAKPDGRAGKHGRTALHAAAGAGRVETVKLLLDAGVDPNVSGDEGTPLNAAANGDMARRSGDKQRMLAVMKVLIDAGADVNRAATDGETPLFNAVRTPPAVEFLLANGADPGVLARDGCNALHRAVAHNKLDSVKMLLAAGTDPNVVGREERYTCLDSAIVRGHKQCRAILEAAGAKRAKDVRKKRK
jgi:ankyrin repeat protein